MKLEPVPLQEVLAHPAFSDEFRSWACGKSANQAWNECKSAHSLVAWIDHWEDGTPSPLWTDREDIVPGHLCSIDIARIPLPIWHSLSPFDATVEALLTAVATSIQDVARPLSTKRLDVQNARHHFFTTWGGEEMEALPRPGISILGAAMAAAELHPYRPWRGLFTVVHSVTSAARQWACRNSLRYTIRQDGARATAAVESEMSDIIRRHLPQPPLIQRMVE